MTKRVRLRFVEGQTGHATEAHAEIADHDWDLFQRYVKYVDEDLNHTAMVREKLAYKIQGKWTKGEGLSVTREVPSIDSIKAFLHPLRPFVLQGEETYFQKVLKRLGRYYREPPIQRYLQELRRLFDDPVGTITTRTLDGDRLDHRQIPQRWLNAYEYHKDPTKQEELRFLRELVPDDVARVLLIHFMNCKAIAIRDLATLIRTLGANDSPT